VTTCVPEVENNSLAHLRASVPNHSVLPEATRNRNSRTILGIKFFAGRATDAVALALNGGLVVAPAAPALVNLPHDDQYRLAVSTADVVITDSSLMVMLWNLTRRDNIPRVSGLEYLTLLLQILKQANHSPPFFVMPTKESAIRTSKWLHKQGIQCAESDCYIAPYYKGSEVEDSRLLALLEQMRPGHIIIGLGGGTQEKLGLFLRRRLSYRPGIHCIGAAIGFLTGDQVRIPKWADRLYLGWLFRCLNKPTSYVPRYWKARKLFGQMIFEKKSDTRTTEISGVSKAVEESNRLQSCTVNIASVAPGHSAALKSPASAKRSQTQLLGI